MITQLSLNGCPSIPWEFTPKGLPGPDPEPDPREYLFTQLSLTGTPGKIQQFSPKGEIVIPTEIDFYFNFEITITVGDAIPTGPIGPGEEVTWQYLRRQVTAYVLPRETTLTNLRRETTIYKWKF